MPAGTRPIAEPPIPEVSPDRLFRPNPDQARRLSEIGIVAEDDSGPSRLTVDEYHRAVEADIFTKLDRIILLEGWLVRRMSIKPPHRIATRQTRVAIERLLPPDWYADEQKPITTAESEPEPDVTVVRGSTRDYSDRHPGPDDLALVVEVAYSSLPEDRGIQKRIYARGSVAVYWIVNLVDGWVEVYSDPTGAGDRPDYLRRRDYGPGESIPVILDGVEVGQVAVSEILP